MTGVYLLHFSPPYFHARHYVGYSDDVEARLMLHLAGGGSPLVRSAIRADCSVVLARVWEGRGRDFERKLKLRKNSPRYCPICNPRQRFA